MFNGRHSGLVPSGHGEAKKARQRQRALEVVSGYGGCECSSEAQVPLLKHGGEGLSSNSDEDIGHNREGFTS